MFTAMPRCVRTSDVWDSEIGLIRHGYLARCDPRVEVNDALIIQVTVNVIHGGRTSLNSQQSYEYSWFQEITYKSVSMPRAG